MFHFPCIFELCQQTGLATLVQEEVQSAVETIWHAWNLFLKNLSLIFYFLQKTLPFGVYLILCYGGYIVYVRNFMERVVSLFFNYLPDCII